MHWEQKIRYAALSDIGFRRQNNEDACAVHLCPDRETWNQRGHLFVVADGMGGHAVGELASKIAVDTVPHTLDKLRQLAPAEALRASIEHANTAIHKRGTENHDFLHMGTTCTTLLLCSQGAIVGNVGDSRVYRIRQRHIEQLSRDHSLIWETMEQRNMSQRDAEQFCPRNIITRSLGPEAVVQVDILGPFPVLPSDVFILCSDGLSGQLSDTEIGIIAGHLSPVEASRLLVNLVNLRGGADNITVIVTSVGEPATDTAVADSDGVEDRGETGLKIATYGLLSAGIVGGLSVAAFVAQQPTFAWSLLAGSTFAGIFWMLRTSFRHHDKRKQDRTPNLPIVSTSQPTRISPAKVTAQFIQYLVKLESELHQTALNQGWSIPWDDYERIFPAVKQAMNDRQYSVALLEYSRIFEILMVGVFQQRQQSQHQTRWSKENHSDPKAG